MVTAGTRSGDVAAPRSMSGGSSCRSVCTAQNAPAALLARMRIPPGETASE